MRFSGRFIRKCYKILYAIRNAMAHVGANDYNNHRETTNRTPQYTVQPKPHVPFKPTFLKTTDSSCKGKNSQSCNIAGRSQPKSLSRIDSSDHVTPNAWSSPQSNKVNDKISMTAHDVSGPTEFPKSRFPGRWKPVPRPCSINYEPDKLRKRSSLPKDEEEKTINQEKLSLRKERTRLASLHLQENLQNNKDEDVANEKHDHLSSTVEIKPRSVSQLNYRKSFTRNPKSPGFGTIRRMFDKPGQAETIFPRPFVSSKPPPQKDKNITRPCSYTPTSPTNCTAWHHVSSPFIQNTSSNSNVHTLQDTLSAVNILSPKPFRTSSVGDENCGEHGEIEHGRRFHFERTEIDVAEEFAQNTNLHEEHSTADARLPKESKTKQTEQETNAIQSRKSIRSENVDVIFEEDYQNDYDVDEVAQDGSSVNNEVDVDEDQRQMISALYDFAAADYSNDSSSNEDQSPDVSSHGEVQTSSSQNQWHPSLREGYLAMSSHTTPEIRYVEMADDTEVEEVDYSNQVVLPPPVYQTKSKREYHEIDPAAPPLPPNREPPRLQEVKSQDASHSSTDSIGEEQASIDPPPLPPDNTVGRRSVIYSKDKSLLVVQHLEENSLKPSQNKRGKKVNYTEVQVETNKATRPSPHGRTNYSDVVVVSDDDFQRRPRSGSGSSDEERTTGNTKSKNVKKKIQSLFSKEDTKSSQAKDDGETLTDFEKERNKKKRISARFLRKKTKDTTKLTKKERSKNHTASDVGVYADNDSGFVTSSETSISGTPPVVASGGSSHGSGDGEVMNQSQGAVSHRSDDVYDKMRWNILPPQNSLKEGKNEADVVPPMTTPGFIRWNKQSKSEGQPESTFLAFPTSKQSPYERTEKSDDSRKVTSFLHGSNAPLKDPASRLQQSQSETHLCSKNNRLSAPGSFNVADPSRTSRSLPKLPPRHHSTNSEPRHTTSSLPGTALPKSHKRDPPLLPPRLSKPPDLVFQKSTSSLSSQPEEEHYEEAVDGTLESNEELYSAAEDIPPPLPEKDETLYESISASHIVPPSPLVKEDDTSKFLRSEPLYQIYRNRTMSHASSKRRSADNARQKSLAQAEEAWESELRLEDMGTCTLWRSLPEVVASGWLDKLTTDEFKLQQAQFEVITSQASYLRSLNILVDHFMRDCSMESADCLPTGDRHRLFSNIETVCGVERKFLQDLENHFWKKIKITRVCELIARYAKADFKVYILYIQNQVYQDRVLTKLQRNNEKFSEELSRLESSPTCNKLPLLSFLLLPMQRVTRLPLLVSAIVNAADSAGDVHMCKIAKHTLGVVNKLVKKCNEGARKMQQTEQLAEIASQLDYSPSVKMYALVSQSRSLVKKGEMTISFTTKKATKTSKLWLFLFSDVLFIAKKKSYMEFGSSPRYEVIDWASRQFLAVNERAFSDNAIFLVILENQAGKRVEMSLLPLAQNELSRWEKALNPPNLGVTGESVYETWDCPQYTCIVPYHAKQPDELSLEVGDVMQVLKKTSDGWLEGERLRDSESGWFPSENCEEIEDEHVRSRNMKNLYRTSVAS